MEVVKNYNNVSTELLKEIGEMPEVATFQLIKGTPNPDEVDAKKFPVLYGKVQIPTQFRIKDKNGKYVDIVWAEGWHDDKPTKAKMFVAGIGEIRFNGKWSLMKNKVEDEELWQIFMLSPYREGSPCADKGIKPIFKLVNASADSKIISGDTDNLFNALSKAKDITKEKASNIMASLGQSFGTDEELFAAVKLFARNKPSEFLTLHADNKGVAVKAEVKKAFDAQILVFDPPTKTVQHNGSILCTLADGSKPQEEFSQWLSTASNAEIIMEAVAKQLKPAKKETKKTEEATNA